MQLFYTRVDNCKIFAESNKDALVTTRRLPHILCAYVCDFLSIITNPCGGEKGALCILAFVSRESRFTVE